MVPENPAYLDKTIGRIFMFIAAVNLSAGIYLIQRLNFKSEKRTEALMEQMNVQNNELKGKEVALNESIVEIKKHRKKT